jgi:translation initiation factor IF-2
MAEEKLIRLSQAARKLNVGHHTILDFLAKKGHEVENNPNAKLTPDQFALLSKEFASSATEKREASGLTIGVKLTDTVVDDKEAQVKKRADEEESIMIKNLAAKEIVPREEPKQAKVEPEKNKLEGIKVVGKIDLEKKQAKVEPPKVEEVPAIEAPIEEEKEIITPPKEEIVAEKPEQEVIKGRADKLKGLKVVDRIELPAEKEKKKDQPVASSDLKDDKKGKRPRKRIITPSDNKGQAQRSSGGGGRPMPQGHIRKSLLKRKFRNRSAQRLPN